MTCGAPDCRSEIAHTHCVSCGLQITATLPLCTHHHSANDDWAAANRLVCDGLHRGQWAPRLPREQREDDQLDYNSTPGE